MALTARNLVSSLENVLRLGRRERYPNEDLGQLLSTSRATFDHDPTVSTDEFARTVRDIPTRLVSLYEREAASTRQPGFDATRKPLAGLPSVWLIEGMALLPWLARKSWAVEDGGES